MRIIFVPQYPTNMRYQSWWYDKLPIEFRKHDFDVHILGYDYLSGRLEVNYNKEMFSPINEAIELELVQISEYMNMELYDDDILFLSDISFPGIFCNSLYHKKCSIMYAFCHATSLNEKDYFELDRRSKFQVECGHAKLFKKIFVGSEYHQDKLGWNNTVVTYLPPFPFNYDINIKKSIDIMSASRPTSQKVDMKIETEIEKRFGKIYRPVSNTWYQYQENLQKSKILLITSHEDTFGYQITDAITNNCIPVAKKSFAYPEILSNTFLYSGTEELISTIEMILGWNDETYKKMFPKIKCEKEMNNFYNKICEEMKDAI